MIKDNVLKKYQKYHYLYWLLTVTYCIPFVGTFLFLYNEASYDWTLNAILGLFWLILAVDFVSFTVIFPLGVLLGTCIYLFIYNGILIFNKENFDSAIINSIWVIIVSILFSRKKELIAQKQKLSELEQLNDELKTNKINLEKALEVKTEFLNNISHEIRTPIQGFMGVSENLDENWSQYNDKQKQEQMHIIARNAKRLASLVGSLLDMTKFNQEKFVLSMQKMDLKEAIKSMIDECNTLYLTKKIINFQINAANSKFEIFADRERIIQVLRNLFINAIKFSKDNKIFTISLNNTELVYDDGNKVQGVHVAIKDRGLGIPIKEIESIFEPFVQSSLSKTKAGGIGLGLAICKEIIKAHHGKIWAENNQNEEGAIFHFVIPIIQERQMEDHEVITEHEIKEDISKEKIKTVMIIDDEEAILATLEIILTTNHYKVLKANSGMAGLKIIKRDYKNIDLILLDLMMPDMYGLNVLSEIKQDNLTKRIPVIIQSGASDEKEKQKCIELGAASLISKPFTRNQILKEIRRFAI